MNWKPLSIFLAIFIVGFGSGFLVSGRLTKKSIEAAKERETPVGFKKDLYKYLKPDEDQKHIIDSIVSEYIPRIKEERAISRLYQKHLRDSMFTQIQQLLDNKQKSKLKKFEEEKIIKKPQPAIARQKDTIKVVSKNPRKEIIESLRESLTPDQQQKLDSIIEQRKKERRNPEMRKEIRVYYRQNILPVLMDQRRNFEDELTEDEKATIETIRVKRNSFRAEFIESQLSGEESDSKAMKDFMEESKRLLQPIIINHKVALESMAQELKPEQEKWETDLDAIKAKYITDYKPKSDKLFRSKEKNAIDFLLMDGEKKFRKPGRR